MDTTQPARYPPGIGAQAPDFETITTTGLIKFADFAPGKWELFCSHPADSTPVCTTELTDFAKRQDEFTALHTALLGLRYRQHPLAGRNLRVRPGGKHRFAAKIPQSGAKQLFELNYYHQVAD